MAEVTTEMKAVFGSSRAGEMMRRRKGTVGITVKLPTTFEELEKFHLFETNLKLRRWLGAEGTDQ